MVRLDRYLRVDLRRQSDEFLWVAPGGASTASMRESSGSGASRTTVSRRSASASSAIREAGTTKRPTIHPSALESRRASSARASATDMLAGGKSAAWSINRSKSARQTSVAAGADTRRSVRALR